MGTGAAEEQYPATAMIIGCGYLGTRTALALDDLGAAVVATTRTERRWAALKEIGVDVHSFDIEKSTPTLERPAIHSPGPLDIYFMLTPSAMSPALATGGGYDQLLRTMRSWPIRRALLVSSTSAYGQRGDAVVTAETAADPADERGRRVVDIETRWLEAGEEFFVCRLAGLYGPGRIIGQRQLLAGESLPGRPERWLNLIHVDDAARLLIACNLAPNKHKVELGSDGHPVQRAVYYGFLAEALGAAPPVFSSGEPVRIASRRCDPSSTMRRTGWHPRYADYRQGLTASLGRDAG